MLSGIVVLNKPIGTRSTYCVNRVKTILGKRIKVGHAGTLDSPAGGILLVLIGAATRLSQYLMELPKIYEVSIVLGMETDTDDYTGNVLTRTRIGSILPENVEAAIRSFQGVRMQIPPQISAVKIDGQRAHRMSREGLDFKILPRPVSISRIERSSLSPYASEIFLRVYCHKGTYIRSLARDLGKSLGCGAYVSGLTRTRIGNFDLSSPNCIQNLDELDSQSIPGVVQPMETVLAEYTSYRIPLFLTDTVRNGNPVSLETLHRIRWGRIPSSFSVVLEGNDIISFGNILTQDNKAFVKPKTNIFLTGEK